MRARGDRRRRRRGRALALDLGLVVDDAGDRRGVAEQRDGQHRGRRARRGGEGRDGARVLGAVLDAVVVGVGVVGVRAGLELGHVVHVVAVLVLLGLVDLEAQVVLDLPLVRDAIVIAVTALRARGGDDDQHERRDQEAEQRDGGTTGHLCSLRGVGMR